MNNKEEYIDINALASWESKLKEINNECLEYLSTFENKCLELKSIWSGKVASTFDNNFLESLSKAREKHYDLTELSSFLTKIANTMKEE